uniref:Uncharacterized protein n=1 Tax=Romanomermis culicivorax TaxID=13658 RepID=A0A915JW11_ROMCU
MSKLTPAKAKSHLAMRAEGFALFNTAFTAGCMYDFSQFITIQPKQAMKFVSRTKSTTSFLVSV